MSVDDLALEASRMRVVGHDDLAGRGNVGEGIGLSSGRGRRTLYLAHESGPANFSVVDVTDPRRPRLVEQTSLQEEGLRSNSLAVVGDLMVVCYQEANGWRGPRRRRVGLEIFDLGDPDHPRPVGFWDASGPSSRGAHCVWFVDGRFAYVSSGFADSRPTHPLDDQFVVILDLAVPTRPVEVGRWWLPGTQEGDAAEPPVRHEPRFDRGFRSHNVNVYPERPERAYCGYIDGGVVILDIADRSRPRMVSRLDYHPPMPGFTHTVLPLLSRDLLAVTDEAVQPGGADWPKPLWLIDASVETNPIILGTAPYPIDDLRRRGGRTGAHNVHENDPVEVAWRSDEIVVGAFFNGGVRAYDVRDPFHPRELGFLVPRPPPGSPAGAAQINDVFVDENRLLYAVDRFTGGLYVVEGDFWP